jgi:2',3'-cyclic-nucleotide 2'-phosphodiesterase (5'-nucleotidase family)
LPRFVWALVIFALLVVSGALIYRATAPKTVALQIIQYSDWHGQLDPLEFPGEGTFGGAAELAAYFRADEAENPNTLIITGGDDFGAAPPLSSFFDEVPSVIAQNLMGTDVSVPGNHNFNRGIDHLQRMIDLAEFSYLAANLENMEENLKGVASHEIFTIGGVDVAVIGLVHEATSFLLYPGTLRTLEVTDAAIAAQAVRDQLSEQGIEVFILVGHIGVDATQPPTGDLIELAESVNGFDLILGDHSDVQYADTINGALVIENRSKGRTYARIELQVMEGEGVVSTSFELIEPFSDRIEPAADVVALLDEYRQEAAPSLRPIAGVSTAPIPRNDSCGVKGGNGCESVIGNVVTDAMRAEFGTDFAILSSGVLRANLTCPTTDDPNDFCPEATSSSHPISRGQILSVFLPGHHVATLSLSGAELLAYLERGVSHLPIASARFAQVSGLCFTHNPDRTVDNKVISAVHQGSDGECDAGSPVDFSEDVHYTIAISDYMASGGDGYPNVISRVDVRSTLGDALAAYLADVEVVSPSIQGRVVCEGTTCRGPSETG